MDEETGLPFASTVAGPDARLRPRHPHRDARRSGASPRRARRDAPGRGALHVPARRGRLSRRPLHARRRAARSASRRGVRAPYHAQRAARDDRKPRRHLARLGGHARDRGRGPRRPRLDAARHPRSGAGRLRNRDGASGDGHAPIQRARGDDRHDHPDRSRERAQRHSRSRIAQGHHPDALFRAAAGGVERDPPAGGEHRPGPRLRCRHDDHARLPADDQRRARGRPRRSGGDGASRTAPSCTFRRRSWAPRIFPMCSRRCRA